MWSVEPRHRHGQVLDEGSEFEAAEEHEGEPERGRREAQRDQHLQEPHKGGQIKGGAERTHRRSEKTRTRATRISPKGVPKESRRLKCSPQENRGSREAESDSPWRWWPRPWRRGLCSGPRWKRPSWREKSTPRLGPDEEKKGGGGKDKRRVNCNHKKKKYDVATPATRKRGRRRAEAPEHLLAGLRLERPIDMGML